MNANDLHPVASIIAETLLARIGEYVPEEDLETATGYDGYACRWYIYQLRAAGFQIDAAIDADREAFRNGARGWTLVDIGGTVSTASAPVPVAAPVAVRKGLRVFHATHGEGRITFVRVGFPKVSVDFATVGKLACEKGELLALRGCVYALLA